jgi:hypothetical protein
MNLFIIYILLKSNYKSQNCNHIFKFNQTRIIKIRYKLIEDKPNIVSF